MVTLEVGKERSQLSMVYDGLQYEWSSTVTLVLSDAAQRAGSQAIRQAEHLVKGLEGKVARASCCYNLPVLDWEGGVQVIRAHEADNITIIQGSRMLNDTGRIFPEALFTLSQLKENKRWVELIVSLYNAQ
jgi:hypothetical protein